MKEKIIRRFCVGCEHSVGFPDSSHGPRVIGCVLSDEKVLCSSASTCKNFLSRKEKYKKTFQFDFQKAGNFQDDCAFFLKLSNDCWF